MDKETFDSSVQYGDMSGSAQADRGDQETAHKWLKDRDYIKEGELLCGIQLSIGENHGAEIESTVPVTFYLWSGDSIDALNEKIHTLSGDSLTVRRVNLEVTFREFFSLFKRFKFTLSPRQGLLEGIELQFE